MYHETSLPLLPSGTHETRLPLLPSGTTCIMRPAYLWTSHVSWDPPTFATFWTYMYHEISLPLLPSQPTFASFWNYMYLCRPTYLPLLPSGTTCIMSSVYRCFLLELHVPHEKPTFASFLELHVLLDQSTLASYWTYMYHEISHVPS